jgi:hypothetical protein
VEHLMMIVIISSPLGSFSITTLWDGVKSASLSGLGAQMTTFFPHHCIGLFQPNQNSMAFHV